MATPAYPSFGQTDVLSVCCVGRKEICPSSRAEFFLSIRTHDLPPETPECASFGLLCSLLTVAFSIVHFLTCFLFPFLMVGTEIFRAGIGVPFYGLDSSLFSGLREEFCSFPVTAQAFSFRSLALFPLVLLGTSYVRFPPLRVVFFFICPGRDPRSRTAWPFYLSVNLIALDIFGW